MRQYLLDTSLVSALLHSRPRVVSLVPAWLIRHEAATSILVYAEVVEYANGRPDFERLRGALRMLLGEIYPYALNYPILERYADIRRTLRPPHGPGLIGDVDTMIAATALERDLTLVTMDSDFQRVSGLDVQLFPRALR